MATDRPLTRKAVKLAASLLLGSSRAHAYDAFPGLVIEKAASGSGTILFRGRRAGTLADPSAWAEGAGPDLTIVGSGPSVAQADFAPLPARSAILLNGAIALTPERIALPLAVAVEDDRFVYRHFHRFLQTLDPVVPCLLSVSAIRAILEHDPGFLQHRRVLLIDNLLKPYGARRRRLADFAQDPDMIVDSETGAGISRSPDRGVFQAGSVAISALQFALACRPATIGFIGVEITNATQPRFYESKGAQAFSGIAGAETRILAHIRLAKTAADNQGIELINYSPLSALSKCGLPFSPRLIDQDAA